jgi:hypothetical protein
MPEDYVPRRELEQVIAELWKHITRLGQIIEGPPHPGLEKNVSNFLIEFRTVEKQRMQQHLANQKRLNLIIAMLGVMGGYLTIYFTIYHH